jgi:hypothetical protein
MVDEAKCAELRQALKDARARQDPPNSRTAVPTIQNVRNVDAGNTTPDADPELAEQIRRIERALRDEGCE